MTWPPVTLVVLNWNAGETLLDCLQSLVAQDYPDFHVVVVDNNSTDGSPDTVKAKFSQVNLICTGENRGFSAGNNVGLRMAQSPFVVLVNPDIIVDDPEWLKKLISPTLADDTIGIVGGKLLFPDKRTIQYAGGVMNMSQAFPEHLGGGEVDDGRFDTACEVDYVIGAVMVLRQEMLAQIGYLDEGYFLYYEDADLCARARRAGYKVWYIPEATAVHIESITTDRKSDFYWQHMFVSRWRYLLKHSTAAALLDETIPVEKGWISALTMQHRHAAATAYRQSVQNFREICESRIRDGAVPFSPVEQHALIDALQQMRVSAWQPIPQQLQNLAAQTYVEERPFRSQIPLLGPLIVWFRTLWNSVATKWYVRPLIEQQNRFNHQLVARLQEQAARLLDQEQGHTDLIEDTAELVSRIQEMNDLLRSIDARLARLEQDNNPSKN